MVGQRIGYGIVGLAGAALLGISVFALQWNTMFAAFGGLCCGMAYEGLRIMRDIDRSKASG